jgi:hypothetical protein
MSTDDWAKTQKRLLEDIEQFARHGPPTSSAPAPSAPAPAQANSQPNPPAQPATIPPVTATAPATPAPAVAPAPTLAPPPAASSAPSAAAGGLLAQLKQQAMAKLQAEGQQNSLQKEVQQQISNALEMTYKYLNDLCQQLNIIKPPYARSYSFFGIVDFNELAWQEGRADFRLQSAASEDRFYDQVTLRYRLSSPKKLQVTRDNPAHEKLHKALFDNNIVFTTDEVRNERGYVERATFSFPCEIKAGLQLTGDYSSGQLVLRSRHIDRFGIMEYRFGPQAVTQEALDELARLILGEPNRIAQLFPRTA